MLSVTGFMEAKSAEQSAITDPSRQHSHGHGFADERNDTWNSSAVVHGSPGVHLVSP